VSQIFHIWHICDISVTHTNYLPDCEWGRCFSGMHFFITVSQTCETTLDICLTDIWDRATGRNFVQLCLTFLTCKYFSVICLQCTRKCTVHLSLQTLKNLFWSWQFCNLCNIFFTDCKIVSFKVGYIHLKYISSPHSLRNDADNLLYCSFRSIFHSVHNYFGISKIIREAFRSV